MSDEEEEKEEDDVTMMTMRAITSHLFIILGCGGSSGQWYGGAGLEVKEPRAKNEQQ